MCGVSLRDRRLSVELGIQDVVDVTRLGRMR